MSEMLSRMDIIRLFTLLNDELKAEETYGELYVVGGAVMCLVYSARASTHDIDAYFKPAKRIRQAAARVSANVNVAENWLNDSVKGYLSNTGRYDHYLELSHLKVMCAQAEYLLAMKCLAMRLGEEFHNLDDIRYLLRNLDIYAYQQACEIIGRYYPIEQFPQKTLCALEELLAEYT